jgi:Holliday junction DNA helicase RuvA
VIASLRGLVTERRAAGDSAVELVVDVAGVGYRLLVAPGTAAGLQLGHEAFLAVHTHVREGAITLYGFSSAE